MKLKFVGTGAIAGADRSACTLIDNKILIDCGNGLLKTLIQQGVNIMNLEAILITHLHADHFFDLPFYVILRYIEENKKDIKIFCPIGTEKIIEHLCDDYVSGNSGSYKKWKENGKFQFIEFSELKNKEIAKGYFATSYEVSHGIKKPAYGFVVKNESKVVGFSGDTTICNNVLKIVEKSNVSVLDMFALDECPSHMSVNNLEEICMKFKNKIIIGTHSTQQAKLYANNKKINNLIVANDGDEYEF